jgi:hypothetical protein
MSLPTTASAPTGQRLYSPGQIALAAFIGSPVAACWFWSRNYLNLGQPTSSKKCLFWGAVGTVVLFTGGWFLPKNVPGSGIAVGYTIGFLMAARGAFESIIHQHLAKGGRLGSWWAVVGISVLCLLGILAATVGVVFLLVYLGYIPEEALSEPAPAGQPQ